MYVCVCVGGGCNTGTKGGGVGITIPRGGRGRDNIVLKERQGSIKLGIPAPGGGVCVGGVGVTVPRGGGSYIGSEGGGGITVARGGEGSRH